MRRPADHKHAVDLRRIEERRESRRIARELRSARKSARAAVRVNQEA